MSRRTRNSKQAPTLVLLRAARSSSELAWGRVFDRFNRKNRIGYIQRGTAKSTKSGIIQFKELEALGFQFARWRPRLEAYDYLLVTSPRVADSLARTLKEGFVIEVREVIAIGAQTAKAFRRVCGKNRFWKKLTVLEESDGRGVVRFLKGAQGDLLYPHSSLAESWLKKSLRGSKLCLEEHIAYRGKLRKLRRHLLSVIGGRGRLVFICTSPSAFQALRQSFAKSELRAADPLFLTLGRTTAAVIRKAGFHARQSREASIATALREGLEWVKESGEV